MMDHLNKMLMMFAASYGSQMLQPLEDTYDFPRRVRPDTLVDEVARQMLSRKVGSAVVIDGGFVVGIFTTTDALRVLGAVRTM